MHLCCCSNNVSFKSVKIKGQYVTICQKKNNIVVGQNNKRDILFKKATPPFIVKVTEHTNNS